MLSLYCAAPFVTVESVSSFSEVSQILQLTEPAHTVFISDLDFTLTHELYHAQARLDEDASRFVNSCIDLGFPFFISTANAYVAKNHKAAANALWQDLIGNTDQMAEEPQTFFDEAGHESLCYKHIISAGLDDSCSKGFTAYALARKLKKNLIVFMDDMYDDYLGEVCETLHNKKMWGIAIKMNSQKDRSLREGYFPLKSPRLILPFMLSDVHSDSEPPSQTSSPIHSASEKKKSAKLELFSRSLSSIFSDLSLDDKQDIGEASIKRICDIVQKSKENPRF